jgi:single-strand DNA-binding protein
LKLGSRSIGKADSVANQHRNEVHLTGYLARDPEVRYTQTGKAVANFTVATTHEKHTDFHKCVAWEDKAENLREKFKKGSFIALAGRLQTRSWDDKSSGQKRYTTEIVAWGMSDGTKDAEKPQPPATPNIHGVPITDDDIPF